MTDDVWRALRAHECAGFCADETHAVLVHAHHDPGPGLVGHCHREPDGHTIRVSAVDVALECPPGPGSSAPWLVWFDEIPDLLAAF